MPGLARRLKRCLETLTPKGTEIEIIEHPNQQLSSWIGGAMLGRSLFLCSRAFALQFRLVSSLTFEGSGVTKEQYYERGSNTV